MVVSAPECVLDVGDGAFPPAGDRVVVGVGVAPWVAGECGADRCERLRSHLTVVSSESAV